MKYDCYKGSKHIGDLKVGSRNVLAVCKGGKAVWRRPYEKTVQINCCYNEKDADGNKIPNNTTAPCDCPDGIRIRIYNARNSHYTHNAKLFHNGVEVVRQNVVTHSRGEYHIDDEGDYFTPIKKGDTFTIQHSGSGGARIYLYFKGFHAIPKDAQ